MTIIEADSAGLAISKAQEATKDEEVMNMTLVFPMELPAFDHSVLTAYKEAASLWQQANRPPTFKFNHGEYMHAYGDPIAYLVDRLRANSTSNRACISLVNSEPIIASVDGALPSFMLVQAGFNGPNRDLLYLTAYYRALETTAFLPMNVAELGLLAEGIADGMTSFSRVQVTMHAFRAHAAPGNTMHSLSELDRASPTHLHGLMHRREYRQLARLLREKAAPASIIEVSGVDNLHREATWAGLDSDLLEELRLAVLALERLNNIRANGSHGEWLNKAQLTVTEHIHHAADLLERQGTR
jgi:thymidylate synthase